MIERKFTPPTEFPAEYVTEDGRDIVLVTERTSDDERYFIGYGPLMTGAFEFDIRGVETTAPNMAIKDKPKVVSRWVNVYECHDIAREKTYMTRAAADYVTLSRFETMTRIAVIRIDICDGKVTAHVE
jgi:hypothetical protein